jgi:hypothetical protein
MAEKRLTAPLTNGRNRNDPENGGSAAGELLATIGTAGRMLA